MLNTMQVQISRHEFNTWVRRTSLLSIANGVATIGAPSAFFKEGFENRYTGAVRSLISDLYVSVSQVRVVITGVGAQGGMACHHRLECLHVSAPLRYAMDGSYQQCGTCCYRNRML